MVEIVTSGDPHVRRGERLDRPTILAVAAGGIGLALVLVFLRFCGELSLPERPPRPRFDEAPERVAARIGKSTDLYRQAIAQDAQRAGLPAPSLEEMGRAFAWRVMDLHGERAVLRPGDPPVELAGLRLSAIQHAVDGSEPLLSLVVENPAARPVAYRVLTDVSVSRGICRNRTILPHNGNVVAAGGREVRSECGFRRGIELYVERVESAELAPLAALYLSLVPPAALGAGERAAAGHRPALPPGVVGCNVAMSQSVRRALEDGHTQWRDLADFYARHDCVRFQVPEGYKAFAVDGAHPLPVVAL
jgi:hypothetical protein